MSFVIDSSDWCFEGLSNSKITEILELFLERLALAKEREEPFFFGNDIQIKKVCGDMDLWTYLYSEKSVDIDIDIKNELIGYFNTGSFYEDIESSWPPYFLEEIVTDFFGNAVHLDYSFVYYNLINHIPFACLSLFEKQQFQMTSIHGQAEVYFVNSEESNRIFWRKYALQVARDTKHNLQILSKHLYPNLYFHNDIWDGINSFEGGYSAVYVKLQKYLAIFNDYGKWIFMTPPPAIHHSDTVVPTLDVTPTNELIEERFQALGITVAPENPDVRRNEKCRKEREIVIDKKTHYCEWHGKIEPHQNRIHVHAPTKESKEKFIVAIFCKHLGLPR